MYIWNDFAETLLKAILQVPDAFEFLPIVEIFERFVNRPPRPTAEYLVDLAASRTVVDAHGQYPYTIFADEEYGHACMFDILNRVQSTQRPFASRLLDRLLYPWLKQLWSDKPVPMVSKWKTTAQLQAIIILLESAIDMSSEEELVHYRDKVLDILSVEPLPRFRFLLEWAVITLCLRLRSLTGIEAPNYILDLLSTDDQSKPKFTASLIKVSTLLCLQMDSREDYGRRLLTQLVVLSASSRIAVRHEAQWHFPILWKHSVSRCWRSVTENIIFSQFFGFIESLEKYQEPPRDRILASFNPGCDINLRTLFQGCYLEVHPPVRPLCTVNEFKDIMNKFKKMGFAEDKSGPTRIPIGPEEDSDGSTRSQGRPYALEQQQSQLQNGVFSENDALAPLQTKSHSLSFREGSSTLLWERKSSSQLVVIASLIENPHNLGGLCRVCEIFGAQEVHLPSMVITKDKAFQSVSVTAELHISVIETPPPKLSEVLRQKKEQGFSLIGIEQTGSSIVLPAAYHDVEEQKRQLPEKCVLILGAERTGIPASILGMVDHCVEIRQWGIIRSLNVQTAAAIVCYEWRRIWEEAEDHPLG
jgi:tRNA guanosine-2'-O-methyltransferase